MHTSKWNVTKFAEEMKSLVDTLKRNEVTFLEEDLEDIVVENFKLVTNRAFKSLVDSELSKSFTDGTTLGWEDLLDLGDGCYETEKNKGEWGKKSPEEERIIALQSQLDALKAATTSSQEKKTGKPDADKSTDSSKGKKKSTYQDWQFENPRKVENS